MRPIRGLAIAYAATALLVFLQSLVLRAIPYDASWFDKAAFIVRVAFFASDVAIFVAVVALARREPSARGFATIAALMAGYAVLSGLLTMTLSQADAFVATTNAVEETMSFAASVLVALAFSAMAKERDMRLSSVARVVFIAVAALVAILHLARAASHEARTIPLAWITWALHVAQPAALAAVAWPLLRTPSTAAKSDAPAAGGYRGGEPAIVTDAPKPRAEDIPPDPSTVAAIDRALGGLTLYRGAFLACVMSYVAFLPMVVIAASVLRGAEALVVLIFLPFATAATSLFMAFAIVRLRALSTFRGGVVGFFAIGAFAIATVTSIVFVLGSIDLSRGRGDAMIAMAISSSSFFLALGVVFFVRILGNAGEQLGQDALARSARWAQAVIVFAVTALASAVLGSAATGYRHGGGHDAAVFLIVVLCLAAFGASITVVVQHIKLVGEAMRILRTRLALAPRIGSPPAS